MGEIKIAAAVILVFCVQGSDTAAPSLKFIRCQRQGEGDFVLMNLEVGTYQGSTGCRILLAGIVGAPALGTPEAQCSAGLIAPTQAKIAFAFRVAVEVVRIMILSADPLGFRPPRFGEIPACVRRERNTGDF